MKIVLNGKETKADAGLRLLDFLKAKGIQPEKVIVELNYEIIKGENIDNVVLKENDRLEVLKFVGGG